MMAFVNVFEFSNKHRFLSVAQHAVGPAEHRDWTSSCRREELCV